VQAKDLKLKGNKKPSASIAQIIERDYPQVFRNWGGPMLPVGINYDSNNRAHSCQIEEM
jgi:hypothetical protein